MPQESISTRPAPVPAALSGDSVRLPQSLFLLLFWSTWLRERLLILLPALTVLCLGLSAFGSFSPIFDFCERVGTWGLREHYTLPFVPSSTRCAGGLYHLLGHGWPILLFLALLVLLFPTVVRWQLHSRFPAEALPDLACLRVWRRPKFFLTSVLLVVAVNLFLFHAIFGPFMIDID